VEGFSTPQSNKRTACLPSPHPVGLQSLCFALLDSLPLRLCWVTAPCQIHTALPPESLLLRQCRTLAPCCIYTPPGSLPLIPLTFRLCLAPALHGMTGSMPHLDPCLLGHTRSMSHRDSRPSRLPPLRLCRAPALCGMIRATPCWNSCPLGGARPQLYRLSR
jgi:hypothetical protein